MTEGAARSEEEKRVSRRKFTIRFVDGPENAQTTNQWTIECDGPISWNYEHNPDLVVVTSSEQVFIMPVSRLISLHCGVVPTPQEAASHD